MNAARCDPYSAKQRFEPLLVAGFVKIVTPPELQLGKPVLLKQAGGTSCISIYSLPRAGQMIAVGPCDVTARSENLFRYNTETYQFKNVNSNCFGVKPSQLLIVTCEADSRFQKLQYGPSTQMIRNPTNGMCLGITEWSGIFSPSKVSVDKCSSSNNYQRFTLQPV